MKKIVSISLLFWCVFSAFAQHGIKGRVIDSIGNPIPLVHVMILNGNTFVVGAVTDSNGIFTIESLEDNTYILKMMGIGYKDFTQEFSHHQKTTDLGVLKLIPSPIALEGVELMARKRFYEKATDRLIINVEQKIGASGGSVLNLLGNTAGVSINQQNSTLSLHGKGKVSIMVDGKLSRVDGSALLGLLQSMSASNVTKIEIFNNPPAKFEANGSGGMINIITKSKHRKSPGGSVTLSNGYGSGEKTGASGNFHYQVNTLGFFGNYSFNRNRTLENWNLRSEFNKEGSQKTVQANSLRKPVTVSHNYSLGTEYTLLTHTVIGGVLSGYSNKWDMSATDKVVRNSNINPSETLDIETDEINHWNHWAGNMYLHRSINDDHEVTLNYDHLYYHDDNPSTYLINSREQQDFLEITKKTPISFDVVGLDYKGALTDNIQLEFGAKATSSNFGNDINVGSVEGNGDFNNDGLSSSTKMEERIHAVYSSFQLQLGDHTRLTTGIRYEHTDNRLETTEEINTIDRNYRNFFPNLVFSHRLNDLHRLQLSYARRIDRPTFNHLAPFVLFLGPDALYSGNANLQPAFIDKIGMEWAWSGKFFAWEYQAEKNAIVEFQPRLSANGEQYIFMAENVDRRNSITMSATIPLRINQWWQIENDLSARHERLRTLFRESEVKRTKESFRVGTLHQFSLTESTKLELSGYYQSPTLFGISTFGSRGAFNMGIQKQLKDNYGTLRLTFNNVFASDNWKVGTRSGQLQINTLETYLPEARIVTVTYTKNFGASKQKSKHKGNSASEEKKRVQ